VERWASIEGLRAWLAWIVVAGHCVVSADYFEAAIPSRLSEAPPICVFIFVIISGFVITHLIVEKQEQYLPYLARRWLRIFPVYAVACIAGYATLPLYAEALVQVGWHSTVLDFVRQWLESQHANFGEHLFAHITMMHGAIPDQVLPFAAVSFVGTAWSLSLEWQFYLVAPFLIALVRRPAVAAILLLACYIGFYLFLHGKFGTFAGTTSFLPGAAPLFAIGIASRLIQPSFRTSHPLVIALCAASLLPAAHPTIVATLIWLGFFAFLCAEKSNLSSIDRLALRSFDLIFANRLVRFWGERSYSVYLMHIPALSVTAYWIARPVLSNGAFFALLVFAGGALTAAISIATFAFIERPGIALGRVAAERLMMPQNS
jgi:peptidoglycan/LPS O-acetylase OafA/YrhL